MTDNSSKRKDKESSTFVTRVLTEIEREHLMPKPRWTYLLRNRALWIAAAIALIVAALSAAATIFILVNAGWRYAPATHGSVLVLLFTVLPSIWLVALILFAAAVYWNIRHTTHGYRYPLLLITTGVAVLAILFGAVLFTTGLGQKVEEGVGIYLPFYQPFLDQERSWWLDTGHGLLVGKVTELAPNLSSFTLQTNSGKTWHIDTSDLRRADITVLINGGIVRVVGVPHAATSTAPFHACFVFPWEIYDTFSAPQKLTALTASTSEIISHGERSELCKGVRPYKSLRTLEQSE